MKNVIVSVHFEVEDHFDHTVLAREVERGLDLLVTHADEGLEGVTAYGAEVEHVEDD